ncbi:MAG: GntR family transcriptional regulator [Chloroflexi bacterium]|nr:GntR family transcriptional regulator [Chloroflexota bacterium]
METSISLTNYPDLGERVYQVLRDQILTGRLAPGSPLLVVELAARLGVSRTPVKDALNRLAAEGLVDDVARKGFFAAKIDVANIIDVFDARLMIETAAVERGITLLTPTELEEMRSLLREMEQCIDEQGTFIDYPLFVEKDSQFHYLIVGTAKNHHLSEVHRRLSVHLHISRLHFATQVGHQRSADTLREHKAIVEAFSNRDLAALSKALRDHVESVSRVFATLTAG